jgi:lipoprotein-releasing system permease protein
MNFELYISLRYLLAKRRQTFISLITLISIAGVAVGVTALIVVLAVMNGFQEDLRNRILGVTSHVVVGSYSGAMSNYEDVIANVEKEPGVIAATPFIYSQVMLTSGRSTSGAVLRGIEPLSASKVIRLQENMIGNLADLSPKREGADPSAHPGIILGSELAKSLGVQQGDWITMISPTGRLTPMGQTPKSKLFQVVGRLQSGMYEYDSSLAYVDLAAAQQFLGIGDTVTGVEIRLRDIYQAAKVAETLIKERLGAPYWARDWMQMNSSLFSALKLEKVVMFVILTLIILVAAFNIVSSLIMLVMEKGRDIAILKAMGATTASIRKIFVLEGFMIGVSGTMLGLLGGFGLCGALERYKFIDLPPGIYHISKLPVKIEAADVAFIALAAIAISLVATLYPSRQAAKLDPSEALRYE